MNSLSDYIRMAAKDGHTRSGMILGIRMAILGLMELGREVPDKGTRDLVVVVETDRCLPDAIELVTGCRLGNRSLKFRDMGKMAATFVDLATGRAIRVSAREGSDRRAEEHFPGDDKETALAKAYSLATDAELFSRMWVRTVVAPEDVPGYHAARTICAQCGEGISFGREVQQGPQALCRSCAGHGYYKLA